ncbi:hypothetical protein [Haloplanus salilacus]|uniref:hypothetical protein n=1 Tax=Haloplanus salilacus TaxID=2949994 RepID=UPI0030D16F9A
MEPTTRPDDELAQQAPLVPDIGRADDARTDGGRTTTGDRTERRRPTTDVSTQREYDDELTQEAPLVPDIGRPETRPIDDTEPGR